MHVNTCGGGGGVAIAAGEAGEALSLIVYSSIPTRNEVSLSTTTKITKDTIVLHGRN